MIEFEPAQSAPTGSIVWCRNLQLPRDPAPTSPMQTAQTHTASNGVSYALHLEAEARFWAEISRILDGGAKHICDVGGGAKPILPLRRISASGLDYVVLDESLEQLERAPEGYERYEASILDEVAVSKLITDRGPFDAVISRWTAEHIPDGRGFHERIFEMLRPGGTAVHLFPTLYSVPFVINRVLSPKPSAAVLFRTSPARKAKFRPYYSWCRGPSARQIRRPAGDRLLGGVLHRLLRAQLLLAAGAPPRRPPAGRKGAGGHPVAAMTSSPWWCSATGVRSGR